MQTPEVRILSPEVVDLLEEELQRFWGEITAQLPDQPVVSCTPIKAENDKFVPAQEFYARKFVSSIELILSLEDRTQQLIAALLPFLHIEGKLEGQIIPIKDMKDHVVAQSDEAKEILKQLRPDIFQLGEEVRMLVEDKSKAEFSGSDLFLNMIADWIMRIKYIFIFLR